MAPCLRGERFCFPFEQKEKRPCVFRGVISVSDPGVPNWLDPVGNSKGLICLRVLRPDRDPIVVLRKVKRADLRKHLPPTTPMVAPQERSEQLRRRMLATERRFRQ